jgi:predicted AlkP superfamily phosphohydrolase/phosphomutase
MAKSIFGYIDPSSGYVLGPIIPQILAFLGAIFLGIWMFIKNSFLFFQKKNYFIILLLLLLAIIGFFLYKYGMTNKQTDDKKIVVIAIDGLDPKIINEGIETGRLPNIKKLKNSGYYSPLGTTIPPQSPVAWASFITGQAPQKHKIYDFITRDPKDYSLGLSYSDNKPFTWQTEPFWVQTTNKNIHVTSLFLPDMYPAPSKMNGKIIAGMGVPDILGTQGSLTLLTTRDYSHTKDFRGKIVTLQNQDEQTVNIEGPKYKDVKGVKTATIPVRVKKTSNTVAVLVQGKEIKLNKGEFSEWVTFKFDAGFLNKVEGIGKFYLKNTGSELEIYLSPINFSPNKPLRPISYPSSYAKDLAREYGLFYTQGLPIDSWALEQGILDEKAFLSHTESILKERQKIYFGELNKFKSGIFIGYFGFADTISHMFWRYRGEDGPYKDTILEYYQLMDGIIGQTMMQLPENTQLIVLSDHGFDSFDYEVNLNSWLYREGYIVLKEGEKGTSELYEGIDWEKTKAFSAGYNGIFLNLKGREKNGSVEQEESSALQKEISQKLLEETHPETGEKLIKKVYLAADLGTDKNDQSSPDLFVGFYKGARASWDSAVGITNDEVIRPRKSKWSGDHLFDPTEVPGVLISNTKLPFKNPAITDIMPYILGEFGK